MPADRTDETDDIYAFDDDEDIYSDDTELDNSSNKENDFDKLKADLRKEVEESVIEAIANGDTNSGVYKGLQRVLARRDRELEQTRNVLADVVNRLQGADLEGSNIQFLESVLQDMLDDDGKKEFNNRKNNFVQQKENKARNQVIDAMLRGQMPAPSGVQLYGKGPSLEDDPTIAQYRKEATNSLKKIVEKAGIKVDAAGLDFGDENEPLVVRMGKLASSIERVKAAEEEEAVGSVRRKGNLPNTRQNSTPAGARELSGRALVERGMAKQIEMMRKLQG